MKTSKIGLALNLITMLSVGTLMSEAAIAAGGWSGGAQSGGGRGGAGFSGGGHAGGARASPGFRGGGYSGGGRAFGRGGYGGGRYVGGGPRGGRNVGIYFGAPIGFGYGYNPYSYYGPSYYSAPIYYPPVPYYYPQVQSAPVTYIERSDEPQIAAQEAPDDSSLETQDSWWYYCVDAKAYYPYVNKCPGGWLRVAAQPAPGSDD